MISGIEKPTLLLDWKRMERNIERMTNRASRAGVVLRPHFKTHQSAAIGEEFRRSGVTAITVSNLDMAKAFAAYGWTDITVAFPVNRLQIRQINELAQEVELHLLVEDAETVAFLEARLDKRIGVWIKIDTGARRTGLSIEDPEAIRSLARQILPLKHLSFEGVLTHAGHTYKARSPEEISQVYKASVQSMQRVRENLRSAGLGEVKISVGDTPGCTLVEDLSGVDEIRPGNYVFYDAMQWGLGACAQEDIAVAVACPMVARHTQRNELVVHGGAVHLSLSHLADERGSPIYGFLAANAEEGWGPIVEGAVVTSLSQEHGVIRAEPGFVEKTEVGKVVIIIPIHSCLTVNLMREYCSLEGERITCYPLQSG
jgi:D-serine deaminase-like pyridoxal phosphate-dependent protein